MYDWLKETLKNRRTPRLVDREDIDPVDIEKIKDVIKFAPSFDKVFPYKAYFLTNSPEGRTKKEQLVEYFRCRNADGTQSQVGDPWDNREMPQPLLSGLVIVYLSIDKMSPTANYGRLEKYVSANTDIGISATYAVLAAQSLGYKTGFFRGSSLKATTARMFTNEPSAMFNLAVTVAHTTVPHDHPTMNRQYFSYKNQRPFVYPNKHRAIADFSDITII